MYKRIFLLICIFFWFFFAFSEESTYQQNYQNFPVIETFSKTDFFPTITELSSKNPIFKQFSQDVEINYKKLAIEKSSITKKIDNLVNMGIAGDFQDIFIKLLDE